MIVGFLLFVWLCTGVAWGLYKTAEIFGWLPSQRNQRDSDWRKRY